MVGKELDIFQLQTNLVISSFCFGQIVIQSWAISLDQFLQV